MLPVEQPFKTYTGLNGQPLDGGFVYFGQPNLNPITSPVTVFWDAAGTQPVAQPLRTVNGYIVRNGTPANVFFSSLYSELVQDSNGRQVFFARTSDDFSIASVVSSFLTNIAASTGAALIGYIQNAIGAVANTVLAKLRERITIHDFMTDAERADVAGAGVLDVTAAVQKAITACSGKTLHVLPGTYRLKTPTAGTLLSITSTIEIIGDKGAIFLIDSTVANTVDVITINPSTLADDGVRIKGLVITPASGTPARDILKINMDATHGLKHLIVMDCLLRATNGKAINLDNAAALNTNGLFLSQIERNELEGGVQLFGLGDSNVIAENVITGSNIGVNIQMLNETSAGGAAAKCQIERNNITSTIGAIRVSHARGLSICDNNIEQTVLLDNGYCVNLSFLDTPASGTQDHMAGVSVIARNKIQPTDPTSQCNGLYIFTCTGTIVQHNHIGTSARGAGPTAAVTIQTSDRVVVDRNNFYLSQGCTGVRIDAFCTNISYLPGKVTPFNSSNFIEVDDTGIGTKGIWKTVALAAGWSRSTASTTAFSFMKTNSNMVIFRGCLAKSSATASSERFATLPTGFLPENGGTVFGGNVRMPASYIKTGAITTGSTSIRVLPTISGSPGFVQITDALTDMVELSLDGLQFYSPEV